MPTPSFNPIRPGDIDRFAYDFTAEIGDTGAITAAAWTCDVSPNSPLADLDAATRIQSAPSFDDHKTSVLAGTMLDGVTYTLTATVNIDDGRVLSFSGDVVCTLRVSPEDEVLSVSQFRAEFPTFADATVYSDEQVAFWVNQAVNFSPIDQTRWGQYYEIGLRLFVAHNLALEQMAQIQGSRGGAPVGAGVPSSKSVGPVSVSYDVEFGTETDAGSYSLTTWGNRFLRLLRMAGSGPIQL